MGMKYALHSEGRGKKYMENIWEQDAEENTWTQEN